MTKKKQNESVIYSIIRMSQKALMFVLAMVGVGYLGGLIAILFDQSISQPLAEFTQVFIPLFQLEIGVYGLGSTLENVQKIRGKIDSISGESAKFAPKTPSSEVESEEQNG